MVDITYFGHSCFKIRGKNVTLLIDPFNQEFTGLKIPKVEVDAVLSTHNHPDHNDLSRVTNYRLVINGPGEYEVGGAQISGISTFHDAENGKKRGLNTVFEIKIDGLTIVHLGDLGHKLTDEQVEILNGVDILMVPVGGGPTIDAQLATKVVNQLEPLIILPMHYQKPGLKFLLDPLDNFLKEIGKEKVVRLPKLSISKDKLPTETEIVILS